MPITVDIGDVIVRGDAERHRLERVAPAVEEAFRLLAEQLERTPLARFGDARRLLISRLESQLVSLDDLLAPRGAARLAEDIYQRLTRERS
jgi:hypothetical protein